MSSSKIYAAIDIGSTKITSLVAQYFPQEEQINVIGVATAPAGGIRKGQIVDIEEATESITRSVEAAERMAGYPINNALVAITAPHISSLNSAGVVAVSNPQGEIVEEDVSRVIEAARAISLPSSLEIIHVIPRQFIVDGQEGILDPIGMSGVRLEVETNIVTASLPAIKNLTRCVNEVGVKINSLVYSGFAAAESVLTETEKELGVILVDIGGTVTGVTIFTEGFPSFVKVLPVGAKNVTNDLAIGLRLSLENAEKLKIFLSEEGKKEEKLDEKKEGKKKEGEEKEGEKNEDEIDLEKAGIFDEEKKKISRLSTVDGIIRPRLDEIFTMIKEEVRESGLGGATPAGVVLTGGGAQVIGVKRSCQRILGLPVRIGTPKEISGLVDEIMNPAYTSVIGLINYAVKRKDKSETPLTLGEISRLTSKVKIGGWVKKIVDSLKPLLP